jgi:hypothetical protein
MGCYVSFEIEDGSPPCLQMASTTTPALRNSGVGDQEDASCGTAIHRRIPNDCSGRS